MISVKTLCQHLSDLAKNSVTVKENISSFYVQGDYSDIVETVIKQIISLSDNVDYQDYFIINIDGQRVFLADFNEHLENNTYITEFELTLEKKALIQNLYSGSGDVDEILFTSIHAFRSDDNGLGLKTPLLAGAINKFSNTRIHVHGLEKSFGGPKLLVIPVESNEAPEAWLSGSELPTTDRILKQVHIVSNENIIVNPQVFELSSGDIESKDALPFKIAYVKHLLVSLSANYYSEEKIELKGVKHIKRSISNGNIAIDNGLTSALAECVQWCYSKDDPDVPLQLLVDRLSLECVSDNLLELKGKVVGHSLEQAKSNYQYVIAKRSDEYRKELKDIYKDIDTVTDKFAAKTQSLSSELLKSLLTIGFIFTVGTISKAIVNNQLMHSPEGQLLFKVVGVFLVFSFVIRWLNASADLKITERALKNWSSKLRSHIPSKEINDLINKQTIWSKVFYWFSLALVTAIQLSIAYAAYYSNNTLLIIGL